MIAPLIWSSTPWGNSTALRDFAGSHWLWLRAVADQAARQGTPFRLFPVGDPGGRAWLGAIQQQYEAANAAVGLAPPPDLASYDLTRKTDHDAFMFALAGVAENLRSATGVN